MSTPIDSTHSLTMTPPPTQPHAQSSPTPSESENIPFNADTSRADLLKVTRKVVLSDVQLISCDRVSEIARRYEVDKNTAQAKLNRLSRKFADITNDEDNSTSHGPKRRRTRHESLPADEDEEVDTSSSSPTVRNERFVYQAGHKFFLLRAPWIHSGDDIFDINIDEDYDVAERFENDENKLQGQLKEIFDLLRENFQQQALRQRWLRRQVSSIHILQLHTQL